MLWYSLEAHHWGTSNEFHGEIRNILIGCPLLCGAIFLAHLSTTCSRWAVVISQCPSSIISQPSFVVRHAAPTIALKAYSSYTPRPMDSKLGRKHWGDLKIKKEKIQSLGNPRWPPWQPSWKSIFRFCSWTKRPIDWKLGRKQRGDL